MNSSTVAISIASLSLVFSTLAFFNTKEEPEAKQVSAAHEGVLSWYNMGDPIMLGGKDDVVREYDRKRRMDNQEAARESLAATKQVTKWSESDLQRINAILSTCQKDADGSRFATCFGPSGGKPTCFCMKTP